MAAPVVMSYSQTPGNPIFAGLLRTGFSTGATLGALLSGATLNSIAPLPATQVHAGPDFWTQYSRPQWVYYNGSYFGTETDSVGDTYALQVTFSGDTPTTTSFKLGTGFGVPNGHDSASIGVRADGRLIYVWGHQNDATYRRITTNPGDISSFGTVATLSGSSATSYSNLFYLSVCNRWFIHWRQIQVDPQRPMVLLSSTDDGNTWGVGTYSITEPNERPYVQSISDGVSRVDFFCTNKHQTDTGGGGAGNELNLYHCYAIFDSSGNPTFYKTDGTSIGSTVTQVSTQCTLIYDGTTSGKPAWNWDIMYRSAGVPWCLGVKQENAGVDHRHVCYSPSGGSWTATEITPSGGQLYPEEVWSSGALCFDPEDTRKVYLVKKVGSAWELQRWVTADENGSWSKDKDITSGSSAGKLRFIPRGIRNSTSGTARAAIAYMEGTNAYWGTFNTSSNLVGRLT